MIVVERYPNTLFASRGYEKNIPYLVGIRIADLEEYTRMDIKRSLINCYE